MAIVPHQPNQLSLIASILREMRSAYACIERNLFLMTSEAIQWERWEGTIEYTFMAPVSGTAHLLGQSLFAVLFGAGHTVIILTVLALTFQVDLSNANFATLAVATLAGSLGFIGLGLVAAVLPLLWPEKGIQMPTSSRR